MSRQLADRDGGATGSAESATEQSTDGASPASAGAWNEYVQALQAKGDVQGGPGVHEKAAAGVAGSGGALPHQEAIQTSFGKHDVRGVKAHVGGAAAKASGDIGAQAYAMGNDVAFAGSPDVHTAAHEAAHVVQQRGGVQLKGGVGQSGDAYEQHADAVADLVVQGKSAEGLLDTMAGGTHSSAVQMKEGEAARPKKTVSSKAARRVSLAEDAIKHTKSVMEFGAGNQKEALEASNFNAYYRMKVMRDARCWELADSVKALASANSEALTAAKADLAKGGNCGEHARVGFDYLRVHAAGEIINRSDVEGLDHAFVLMGDVAKESDADITVCDPWPTAATACIWEDHFAHTAEKAKINLRHTMTADGKDVKAVIAAGLKLSARGRRMIENKKSERSTKKALEDGLGGWIWEHSDAHAEGKDYDYQAKPEE